MTKKQILFCATFLFSQICMATIIIDVDIKYSFVVPDVTESTCPLSGCSYPWVDGQQTWIILRAPAPSSNYMPFTIIMKTDVDGAKRIFVSEAKSNSDLPGVCLALPNKTCYFRGSGLDTVRLRKDVDGQDAGRIYFALNESETSLTVSMDLPFLISQGYSLDRTIWGIGVDTPIKLQTGSPSSGIEIINNGESEDRNLQITNASGAVQVSPNPFSKNINVRVTALDAEAVSIKLINANGQILRRQTYDGNQDGFPFQTQDIPLGCYFLRVQAGDRVYLHRVVKIE